MASWTLVAARGELADAIKQQFLECPPAIVADWPDGLVRFIGYAKAGNGLGYWRDSEDPLSAVHPERDFERGWATVRPD